MPARPTNPYVVLLLVSLVAGSAFMASWWLSRGVFD